MKSLKYTFRHVALLPLVFILGVIVSCKKNDNAPLEYIKGLSEIAAQYNKKCPKDEANGTTLESVTFSDDTLKFRMTLSDQAIVMINLDDVRDSIIHNMSDKLKKFLVKGNCNLEYKYVSPNDSSSITIVPNELGDAFSKEK